MGFFDTEDNNFIFTIIAAVVLVILTNGGIGNFNLFGNSNAKAQAEPEHKDHEEHKEPEFIFRRRGR